MAMRDLELTRVVDEVNQGDETACGSQTQLHCGESHQHDEIANGDVPDAHGVLLEGEQVDCASGSTKDSNGTRRDRIVECVEHIFPWACG